MQIFYSVARLTNKHVTWIF